MKPLLLIPLFFYLGVSSAEEQSVKETNIYDQYIQAAEIYKDAGTETKPYWQEERAIRQYIYEEEE